MATIEMKDGTQIFYKDWGRGRPIVFSHGWPLNADAWDDQLFFFASKGYRVIAHDRRGHGRSEQPSSGYDYDTFADDLAAIFDKLELQGAFLVGHSMGGGEVARYIARSGTRRLAGAALVSSVPPLMLKTAGNPGGIPISVFDDVRAALLKDRSQFYQDLSAPFYGANRSNSKVTQGLRDQFWLYSMQAGLKAAFECIKQYSETDFTEDLGRFDVPTLVLHGDDDQIVPIANSAERSAEIIRNATLKVYPGASHGPMHTHKEQFNADLLAFIKAQG